MDQSPNSVTHRRTLLNGLGIGTVVVLAGCLSNEERDGNNTISTLTASDPGSTYYPEDPDGPEEVVLSSDAMEDSFYDNYMRYRMDNERVSLNPYRGGIGSVARSHGYDMATNDYVGPNNPDGSEFTPAAYDDTMTSCEIVDRLVYTTSVTVVNADGQPLEVTSEGVVTEMLAEMLDDDTLKEELMRSGRDYETFGVGFYLDNHEADDGSVVADVYLTLDYCGGVQNHK